MSARDGGGRAPPSFSARPPPPAARPPPHATHPPFPRSYVRTTSAEHKRICRNLWSRCESRGGIYLGVYAGWYNVREETFVTETDAQANDYKDPVSGLPLKRMEEPSYFFRLGQYEAALIAHIESHPEFIVPESRRNEVLAKLRGGLNDLSISRTTFDWGIACPGDAPDHVMYVWFDALTNYITGVGYDPSIDSPLGGKHKDAGFWPAQVHVIGKDIVWFHCVIWPAMLLCAGLPLPRSVLAHGFVHGADGKKMSKSIGNVVDPYDVLTRCSVDTFRFFLMREAPFGADLTFSETALKLRHNAELADTYGNLVNRALALCVKYNGGKIPPNDADAVIDVGELRRAVEAQYATFQIDAAAGLVIGALHAANKYVTDTEPWHMKADDPRRLVVVRTCLESIYVTTLMLQPLLVDATAKVFEKLGTPPIPIRELKPTLSNLTPGTAVTVGDVLFEKLQTAEAIAQQQQLAAEKKKAAEAAAKKKAGKAGGGKGGEAAAETSDLSKVDVRVGRILEVMRHAEADTLYVEKIDVGEESPRQVVSGLVKHIPIEQMQGRRVVIVANLKPSKMRGVESQAMVLCATSADGATVELVEPPEGAKLGERVTFAGHDAEPERQLNPKKKVWEKVQPELNTSADKVARWGEIPFTTSAGVCTAASVAGGTIK